jgi:L-lactate utilization protein LutB
LLVVAGANLLTLLGDPRAPVAKTQAAAGRFASLERFDLPCCPLHRHDPMPSIDSATRRLLRQKNLPLTVLSAESFDAGRTRELARRRRLSDLPDAARLRAIATEQRRTTVEHLDRHLADLTAAVTANGDLFQIVDSPAVAVRLAGRDAAVAGLIAGELSLPGVTAVFCVAETGHVCILSEDDFDSTPSAVVAGIDAVVPTLADLAVVLKIVARNAVGRAMTRRTLLLGGPGRTGDDPAIRVILLDRGRSKLRDGPYRDLLRCIGCNACGVVCPVYATAPAAPLPVVRALLDPLLRIDPATYQLPWASTRCGACGDACPVGIDLPDLLDKLRRQLFAPRLAPLLHRARHRFWAWAARSPWRYRVVTRWRRKRLLRNFPPPARHSFQDLWSEQ